MFHRGGLDEQIVTVLRLDAGPADLRVWQQYQERMKAARDGVTVSVVGKYTHLRDAYKSIHEAISHGGVVNGVNVKVEWVDSERIEMDGPEALLGSSHGVLIRADSATGAPKGWCRERATRGSGVYLTLGSASACSARSSSLLGTWWASTARTPPSSIPRRLIR